MVSLAVDASVPLVQTGGERKPAPSVYQWVREAIDAAVSVCGGSFYLPYYQFATKQQFDQAYLAGAGQWRASAAKYNPQLRLNNDFLSTYL
jgi:hypothetical protein